MSVDLFVQRSDVNTAGQYKKKARTHLCLLIIVFPVLVQEIRTHHGDWQVAFTQLAELPQGNSRQVPPACLHIHTDTHEKPPWLAQYNTWLLIELTSEDGVFSLLFHFISSLISNTC